MGFQVMPDQITWSGADNLATYTSSDWAERGFCKICGSSLFWRLTVVVLCGGLLAACGGQSAPLDFEVFDIEEGKHHVSRPREEMKIEDYLQKGQEVVVQIIKEPIGTKGPRVTTNISLAGRFMVLMPLNDMFGIDIGYWHWMTYGMPFVLLFIPITWFIVNWRFKPRITSLAPAMIQLKEEIDRLRVEMHRRRERAARLEGALAALLSLVWTPYVNPYSYAVLLVLFRKTPAWRTLLYLVISIAELPFLFAEFHDLERYGVLLFLLLTALLSAPDPEQTEDAIAARHDHPLLPLAGRVQRWREGRERLPV